MRKKNPQKAEWCYTAAAPVGIVCIYCLIFVVRRLLACSSSDFFFSFFSFPPSSSLLSLGCVGEISGCFSVLQKKDYGSFQQNLQAWWDGMEGGRGLGVGGRGPERQGWRDGEGWCWEKRRRGEEKL